MQQPVIHQHLGRHEDSRAYHLATGRAAQGSPCCSLVPLHTFQIRLRLLAFLFPKSRVCCTLGVFLLVGGLRPHVLDGRRHQPVVLEALAAEHGQHLDQLAGVALQSRLLADGVIGLGSVVYLRHLGHDSPPPCITAAGVRRKIKLLQVVVHIVFTAFPQGHARFHVHVFQPSGAGYAFQRSLHRSRALADGVQFRRRPIRKGRFQLPVSMIHHLLADALLVLRAVWQHLAVGVPRRFPSQIAGRGRHAGNLSQRHTGVQRQHRAGIVPPHPAQEIKDVFPCPRLLLQVGYIVLHKVHAVIAKALAHRCPKAALLTAVCVPDFICIPDCRCKARICRRVRQGTAHDTAGFFQQHWCC